ncbi:MAG: hypothetical protein OER95_11185 [Acidimicrobiia bacterium]|nr:hypothetical protein [Acidimicrobiia bacterium]
MAIGEGSQPGQASSPLQWLGDVLWPDGQARLIPGSSTGSVVGGGHEEVKVGLRWWASPNASSAEILIPAQSRLAARTAVRRYHDGFTLRRRVRSWAAETIMAVPGLAPHLLDRQLVTVDGRATDGVLCQLAEALSARHRDLRELHVAVSLARPKSNRKPVLQLIDENGRCLGWAKVGWNPWTTRLVANEARWLQAGCRHPLIMPRLLDELTIGGRQVVITSGAGPSRWPRRMSGLDPDLILAVADLGPRDRVRVCDSPWWASVEQVRSVATPSESRAIDQVVAATDGLLFDIGAWHGDLTPWNIMSASGPPVDGRRFWSRAGGVVRQVIDWEFAAEGVPVGFDLCHYHTQVGAEMKGMTADQALDHSARLSPQGLAAIGVDPHNRIAVFRLYLVELIRRTLALRSAGMPVDALTQGAAAVRRIRVDPVAEPVNVSA